MTTTKQLWRLAKLPLAVSLASTLAAPAFGVTFNIGEIERFDPTIYYPGGHILRITSLYQVTEGFINAPCPENPFKIKCQHSQDFIN